MRRLIAILIAACVVVTGCTPGGVISVASIPVGSIPQRAKADAGPDQPLNSAMTGFGARLLERKAALEPRKNIVISPVSIEAALSMLANGAGGQTAADMRSTLGIDAAGGQDASNQAWANLIGSLRDKRRLAGTDVRLTDSLWIARELGAKEPFVRANADYYAAEVHELDVDRRKAVEDINTWVTRGTEGKIPRILERLTDDERLVVVNALYVKLSWDLFEAGATYPQPFTVDGSRRSVETMHATGSFPYAESRSWQAVGLPAKGGAVRVWAILPQRGATPESLLPSLASGDLAPWKKADATHGAIAIPKFKAEYSTRLEEDLKQLGMGSAFADDADFTGVTDLKPTYINQVVHKTYFEMNEKGVEAAAATAASMVAGAAAPAASGFEFVADRPFLIVMESQGAPLFLGVIRDPR